MPRPGQEPSRRAALTAAALEAIHDRGMERVTVADIARRAGVSPALAHHYFGAKADLVAATMRSLLRDLSATVSPRLKAAREPRARLSAIIEGNLAPEQFRPATVSAWLALYALAGNEPEAARLLALYHRRLRSNLVHALTPLAGAEAGAIAETLGALIDGLWLRRSLVGPPARSAAAIRLVEDAADALLRSHARS